jgi:hypothetical protein
MNLAYGFILSGQGHNGITWMPGDVTYVLQKRPYGKFSKNGGGKALTVLINP